MENRCLCEEIVDDVVANLLITSWLGSLATLAVNPALSCLQAKHETKLSFGPI